MNINEIKQAIRNGRTVFGTLIISTSPQWPVYLRNSGLDFVFLDTEHIALNRETLSWMCRVYQAQGLPPIVRIPSPDSYMACQALDGGAQGILVPYVETVDQVKQLVGAVKWKPLKGERLQRFLDGEEELEPELKTYLQTQNENLLALVNIESVPAIRNLEAILTVPGLDGIVLGPHDLSCSLGIPEQYEHPRFMEAIKTIAGKTRARGMIAGAHFMNCGPLGTAETWMGLGFNLWIHHADVVYAAQGLRSDINLLRKNRGESQAKPAEGIIV